MGRMESFIENATIIQKNGVKQLYDAILITDKGIYTGSLNRQNQIEQDFEEHGFIPRDQIEKITVFNKNGKTRDIEI